MLRPCWAAVALVIAASAPAFAEDNAKLPNGQPRPLNWRGGSHVVSVEPLSAFTEKAATISPYIYLNRCTGGCNVMQSSMNDARTNQSTIPKMGSGCPGYPTCVVQEFQNSAGMTGAA